MKKTSILFLSLVCFVVGFAQSPRTVLLEHFTQASCGPCATFNPAVENYLNTTTHDMISVKYQASFPGVDPMYTFSKAFVDNRQSYYGVNTVPRSVVDGNIHNGAPISSSSGWNESTIAGRSAVTSPFTITMDYGVRQGFDSIGVTMTIEATQAYTGSFLQAHVVIVEKEISFCQPPGNNGETDFYYVMKRMLPSANGTSIPATWTAGQTEVINLSWMNSSAYNPSQFAVIGFIQENNGKEILQAGIKEDYTSPHSVEAMNLGVSGEQRCSKVLTCEGGSYTPSIEVANLGSTPITSMDIEYGIVGGSPVTFNWTGNIPSAGKEQVVLPPIAALTTLGIENLNTSITNVNGGADELPGNNNKFISAKVENYEATQTLTLELTTDRYGSETTWAMVKSDGTVAYSGGPYQNLTANGTTVQTPVNMVLDPSECYYFEILDSYGDGICCSYGQGSFRVYDDQGFTLAQGGAIGSEFIRAFTTQLSSNIEDVIETSTFNVFPNPVDGAFANVEFSVIEKSNVSIRVHSLLGDVIYEKNLGSVNSGTQLETLELAGISNGVYMVTLVVDNDVITKKISVLR